MKLWTFYHRKPNYMDERRLNNAKLYLHGQFCIFLNILHFIFCTSYNNIDDIQLSGKETGKVEWETTKLHEAFLMPQRESDSNKTVREV